MPLSLDPSPPGTNIWYVSSSLSGSGKTGVNCILNETIWSWSESGCNWTLTYLTIFPGEKSTQQLERPPNSTPYCNFKSLISNRVLETSKTILTIWMKAYFAQTAWKLQFITYAPGCNLVGIFGLGKRGLCCNILYDAPNRIIRISRINRIFYSSRWFEEYLSILEIPSQHMEVM